MASISINIDKRGNKNSGGCRLCISHNSTKSYIPLNIQIDPQYLTNDPHNPIIFPSTANSMGEIAQYSKYYEIIQEHVRKCEVGILELKNTRQLRNMTANDIRAYIYGEPEVRIAREKPQQKILFKDIFDKFVSSRNSDKYKASYTYTWKLLERFDGNVNSMHIDLIGASFVKDFDIWMTKQGLGISSRGIALRNLKAVCNDAIDREYMDANKYPFRKISIPRKRNMTIDYLTIEDMQKLLSLDLRNQQGVASLTFARDVLLISFLCCGANLKDIYLFDKPKGDEIVFVRSKIQYAEPRPVHIKILPELQSIVDKYCGEYHLFNFCEKEREFETFQRNLNKRFKRLSILMGRKVNMAIIRHTWATLCYQNGTDKSVIDKSLGHVDSDISSVFYIQYDWDMTHKANRSITNKIMHGVTENAIPTRTQIRA